MSPLLADGFLTTSSTWEALCHISEESLSSDVSPCFLRLDWITKPKDLLQTSSSVCWSPSCLFSLSSPLYASFSKMYFEYFTFLFQKLVSLWLYWIFMAVCRLSLVAMHEGLLSNCGAWTSHCSCFFCCGAQALGCVGSVVVWLPGLVASRQVESSRKRDETCVPCSGRQIPNHWTTREVQNISLSWSKTLQWLLLQNWAKIPNRQVGVRGGRHHLYL